MPRDLSMMSPIEVFIARSICYCDDYDVLAWARSRSQLDEHADDPNVAILLSTNDKSARQVEQVESIFASIVKTNWPSFRLSSSNSEKIARSLFEGRLQEYIDELCRPWDVCRMIHPIEELFDFPRWLGRMFDACDWIGPDTESVDCRHLMDEIRAHLSTMG